MLTSSDENEALNNPAYNGWNADRDEMEESSEEDEEDNVPTAVLRNNIQQAQAELVKSLRYFKLKIPFGMLMLIVKIGHHSIILDNIVKKIFGYCCQTKVTGVQCKIM
ncbi:hypothetical protein QE152_g24972 [Popillia japonica]|uniref:Uncharacterized protein n=1 Tax=Popillia japonica TaxID=7064 RepID=A0AAW1K2Q9_POPJA